MFDITTYYTKASTLTDCIVPDFPTGTSSYLIVHHDGWPICAGVMGDYIVFHKFEFNPLFSSCDENTL